MPQSLPQIPYKDIITLTAYMAEHDYSAAEIAYAVEKPWKFVDLIYDVKLELDEDIKAQD